MESRNVWQLWIPVPETSTLGTHPRGFYEFEDSTLASIVGAAESSQDMFENTLRARMASTAVVRETVVEEQLRIDLRHRGKGSYPRPHRLVYATFQR